MIRINKIFIFIFIISILKLNAQDGRKEIKAIFSNSINSPAREFDSNGKNMTGLFIDRISSDNYIFFNLN
jgi:hypothetical protein